MREITIIEGSDLMREWGVSDWTNVDGKYWLWDDCCVFVTIDKGEYLECHIAMEKSQRSRCRDAGYAILDRFGGRHMLAPVLPQSRKVVNFLHRMGFDNHGIETATLVDGRRIDLIMMVRLAHGRSN